MPLKTSLFQPPLDDAMLNAEPTMRLPDFLCLGGMRCGSTTLWHVMGNHERIFLPEIKELHFFDDRDGVFSRGLQWYSDHFAPAAPQQLCGEFTPEYLCLPEACHRIRDTLPQARFIVILRNPGKRAWSHYWHRVRSGEETLNFEQALDAEPGRLNDDDPEVRRCFGYASWGRYIDHLRRYESAFGRQRLCVVTLEEMLRDPAETARTLWQHLGLPAPAAGELTSLPRENSGWHPRWRRLHLKLRGKRFKSRPDQSLMWRAVCRTARRLYELNQKPGLPKMPADVEQRLRAMFADSDRDLSVWLGRPVPWAAAKA